MKDENSAIVVLGSLAFCIAFVCMVNSCAQKHVVAPYVAPLTLDAPPPPSIQDAPEPEPSPSPEPESTEVPVKIPTFVPHGS